MSYARAGSSPAFGTINLRFLKLTYIDSQAFHHDLRVWVDSEVEKSLSSSYKFTVKKAVSP